MLLCNCTSGIQQSIVEVWTKYIGGTEIAVFKIWLMHFRDVKGTVRRDARWVKNGLKRCVLTNYMTASLLFLFLKRHHHEKSIKPVSASWQQLNWICRLNWQNPANDGLRSFNSIDFSTSHELQATSLKPQAASFNFQATSYELQVMSYEIRNMSYELIDMRYKIAPATVDDGMVQPCTVVWLYGADMYRTFI